MLHLSSARSVVLDEAENALVLTFEDAPSPGHPDPAGFIPTRRVVLTLPVTSAVVTDLWAPTEGV